MTASSPKVLPPSDVFLLVTVLIQPVTPPDDEDYLLDKDLADEMIRWLRRQDAAAPDKPFMAWYSPGTAHAPHQAPKEWVEKFRGQFRGGWDVLRERSFERQKSQGLVPDDAILTPRPDLIEAWESLSPGRKRINERFMEVFAATLEDYKKKLKAMQQRTGDPWIMKWRYE